MFDTQILEDINVAFTIHEIEEHVTYKIIDDGFKDRLKNREKTNNKMIVFNKFIHI